MWTLPGGVEEKEVWCVAMWEHVNESMWGRSYRGSLQSHEKKLIAAIFCHLADACSSLPAFFALQVLLLKETPFLYATLLLRQYLGKAKGRFEDLIWKEQPRK